MNVDELPLFRLRILRVRDEPVLLDGDLAELYDAETKTFNKTIKRNVRPFLSDFAFQITDEEFVGLRSQIVTSKARGGHRYLVDGSLVKIGLFLVVNLHREPTEIHVVFCDANDSVNAGTELFDKSDFSPCGISLGALNKNVVHVNFKFIYGSLSSSADAFGSGWGEHTHRSIGLGFLDPRRGHGNPDAPCRDRISGGRQRAPLAGRLAERISRTRRAHANRESSVARCGHDSRSRPNKRAPDLRKWSRAPQSAEEPARSGRKTN